MIRRFAGHSGSSSVNYIHVFDTMIGVDGTFKVDHKVVDAQGFFYGGVLPQILIAAVRAPCFVFRKLMKCVGVMTGMDL